MEAEAYLLGVRSNQADESPYAWSFQAEHLDVTLETRHYLASTEVDNRTETATHHGAHGFLLERYPLAYLMATSAVPDDAGTTFSLDLALPPTRLDAATEIDFDVKASAAEGEPFPLIDVLYNNTSLSDQPYRSFKQPWSNLEQKLSGFHGSITLTGDFVLHTYDAVFQVQDETGQSTTYNATYGGWRGAEAETDTSQDTPPPEYDVTDAELRFTNATFTFRPAGRPLQFNLRSAQMEATGGLFLQDVDGSLRDGRGVEKALDGSRVELDAKDLHLATWPVDAGGDALRLGLTFEGTVDTATVDGRSLHLEDEGTGPGTEVEGAEVPATLAPAPSWNVNWWLVLVLVVSAPLAWASIRWATASYRARVDPEYVTRQGQDAFDQGRISRAHALAKRVLHHHPEYQDAVALKAMLHLRRRQHSDALSFLEPYLLGPADGGGLISLIYCVALREEKGIEKARLFFQEAVKHRPAIIDVAREYPGLIDDFLFGQAEQDDRSYI